MHTSRLLAELRQDAHTEAAIALLGDGELRELLLELEGIDATTELLELEFIARDVAVSRWLLEHQTEEAQS